MTGRTAHAINRADVCILVVDAATGVSMQDKKIAGLIQIGLGLAFAAFAQIGRAHV